MFDFLSLKNHVFVYNSNLSKHVLAPNKSRIFEWSTTVERQYFTIFQFIAYNNDLCQNFATSLKPDGKSYGTSLTLTSNKTTK